MTRFTRYAVAAGLTAIVLVLAVGAYYGLVRAPAQQPVSQASREPLRIGLVNAVTDALAIVALDQGYFREEGLDVDAKYYTGGTAALAALLNGEMDMASVAETPIVHTSFVQKDFSIVGSTSSFDDYPKIVGRKSHGISAPADLRGKRIATQKASAVQFFLHVFLTKYGLSPGDVQISFMAPEEMADALAAGRIDAFAMREPFVTEARAKLGDDIVVLSAPGLYTMTINLTASKSMVRERPDVIKRALRAMLRAEAFASRNPRQLIELLAKSIGIQQSEVFAILMAAKLTVGMEQTLLLTLEEQARWAINSKLTDAVRVPNYLDYIYFDALQSLKPSAVTLIH